jgi:hypothetical protein
MLGASLPVPVHAQPASHGTQAAAELAPVALLYFPGGHGNCVAADVFAGQ